MEQESTINRLADHLAHRELKLREMSGLLGEINTDLEEV